MTRRPDIYSTYTGDTSGGRIGSAIGRAAVIAVFALVCAWVQGLPGAPRLAWAFLFFLFPLPFVGWAVAYQGFRMVCDLGMALVAYRQERRRAAMRAAVADDEVPPAMTASELRAEMAKRELDDYIRSLPPFPRERYSERASRIEAEKKAAAEAKEDEAVRHSTTVVTKKDDAEEACEYYYPPDTRDEAHRMFVRQMETSWDMDSAMGDERDRINDLRQKGKL